MKRPKTVPMGKRGRAAEGCAAHNDEEVLRVLQSAVDPMSAYEILEALRETSITAPTTVYRALSRLVRGDAVHRLESINAYVACRDHPHQHGPTAFVICRDCGRVGELAEADIVKRLEADATRLGFRVEAMTIEVTGRCASCTES